MRPKGEHLIAPLAEGVIVDLRCDVDFISLFLVLVFHIKVVRKTRRKVTRKMQKTSEPRITRIALIIMNACPGRGRGG